MRRGVAVLVLAVVAVACGDGAGSDSPSDSTSQAPTSAPLVGPPSPSTSAPPAAVAPPATMSASTSPPPDTTVVESTAPASHGVVLLGEPDPTLLPALPPTDIDWTAVGPGWLLIDHGPDFFEPTKLDRRGFYLVSPDDVVYAASALPTDGSWPSDVSADRRHVLLQLIDHTCSDGCSCPGGAAVTVETDVRDDSSVQQQMFGYAVLDLASTSLRSVIDPVAMSVCDPAPFLRWAEFTEDSGGIWVSETWSTDDHRVMRVRLSRVEIATGASMTILDEPVDVDETPTRSTLGISLVELDDGRIVVGTRAGTWLREPGGSPLLELDAPDAACEVLRMWDANHVFARCPAAAGEHPVPPEVPVEECPASGLWLIALDGTPARPLAVPVDDRGYVSCWAGYVEAVPLGDEIAVQVGGDGCSDDVAVISVDGTVTRWVPDIADPCTELLFGVRNEAWLIGAFPEDGASAIFEVTSDGSTEVELPSGRITVL